MYITRTETSFLSRTHVKKHSGYPLGQLTFVCKYFPSGSAWKTDRIMLLIQLVVNTLKYYNFHRLNKPTYILIRLI